MMVQQVQVTMMVMVTVMEQLGRGFPPQAQGMGLSQVGGHTAEAEPATPRMFLACWLGFGGCHC